MPVISKVWIEDDCITCDACSDILPEVFDVTDDSSFIIAAVREDGNFDRNLAHSPIKSEYPGVSRILNFLPSHSICNGVECIEI